MYQTSKVALSALAAVVLLATGSIGDAAGQTGQKQIEMRSVVPQQKNLKLQRGPSRLPFKPGTPGGPGGLETPDPVALPDLILEPGLPGGVASGMPNTGYCMRKGNGGPADTVAFKVRFASNGTQVPPGGWGETQVKIHFPTVKTSHLKTVVVAMPSPISNVTVPFEVDIPGCFSPGSGVGCPFTITVDPTNVVPETSNANNYASAYCAAPAG